MDTKKDKQKGVYRFIGGIEKAVNKLPSPFMMFIGEMLRLSTRPQTNLYR